MKLLKELKQEDFNVRLVRDLGMRGETPNRIRWAEFECPKCYKITEKTVSQVKIGTAKGLKNQCISCSNSDRATTHGETGTILHSRWRKMIARCTNKHYEEHYKDISYCTEWSDFLVFKQWALQNGFKENLELDRKENDKGYYPDNCRWTTRNTQVQNTRVLRKNNTSGYRGIRKLRNKWQARISINKKTIYLGVFNNAKEAAIAYDNYVILNNLEHTTNGLGQLPTTIKDNI